MAIDENVEKQLTEARRFADKGNAFVMDNLLRLARGYADKVGLDISEQVAHIEGIGYKAAVPVELAEARGLADEGSAFVMDDLLRSAQRYADKVGLDISEQVAHIEGIGYKAAVPVELAKARGLADKGNAFVMNNFLRSAQRYAQRAGQDISERVAQIEGIGYRLAVPVELEKARQCAGDGYALGMDYFLQLAQGHADKAGKDISEQVLSIRASVKT